MDNKRQYSMDVLKIMATILIIFHHYQQITGAVFQRLNFWNGTFYFGYIVELFFIISGFFIYSYIPRIQNGLTFKTFYLNRFLRLFPLLTAGAITYEIICLIYQNLFDTQWLSSTISLWGTIAASLGIHEGWGISSYFVNYPTWYISVLLICYIVFYISVCIAKRLDMPVAYPHIAIIFLGIGIQTTGLRIPFFNSLTSRGYYAFFFGILLAGYLRQHTLSRKTKILCALIVILFPICIHSQTTIMSHGINYLMTFIYYPALIIIFQSNFVQRLFQWKWIGTLGKISFNVFIWHNPLFPVMYIIFKFINWTPNLNSVKAMITYTIICYIVGTISYFIIEIPANKYIKKHIHV